jgi:hypothetical protein
MLQISCFHQKRLWRQIAATIINNYYFYTFIKDTSGLCAFMRPRFAAPDYKLVLSLFFARLGHQA